jgi:hypothetical protein
MTNTIIDPDSLTPAQLAEFEASPMTQADVDALHACEARMNEAFLEAARAELKQGAALHELKEHPSLLWQGIADD